MSEKNGLGLHLLLLGIIVVVVYVLVRFSNYSQWVCDSCMSVPRFERAKSEQALIAVYKTTTDSLNWIYLTKGSQSALYYDYFTEDYFAAFYHSPPPGKFELKFTDKLTTYEMGNSTSYRGTREIPLYIDCIDSNGRVVAKYLLSEKYLKNIEASGGRYYLDVWKEILF